jgi:hypothetical protein
MDYREKADKINNGELKKLYMDFHSHRNDFPPITNAEIQRALLQIFYHKETLQLSDEEVRFIKNFFTKRNGCQGADVLERIKNCSPDKFRSLVNFLGTVPRNYTLQDPGLIYCLDIFIRYYPRIKEVKGTKRQPGHRDSQRKIYRKIIMPNISPVWVWTIPAVITLLYLLWRSDSNNTYHDNHLEINIDNYSMNNHLYYSRDSSGFIRIYDTAYHPQTGKKLANLEPMVLKEYFYTLGKDTTKPPVKNIIDAYYRSRKDLVIKDMPVNHNSTGTTLSSKVFHRAKLSVKTYLKLDIDTNDTIISVALTDIVRQLLHEDISLATQHATPNHFKIKTQYKCVPSTINEKLTSCKFKLLLHLESPHDRSISKSISLSGSGFSSEDALNNALEKLRKNADLHIFIKEVANIIKSQS